MTTIENQISGKLPTEDALKYILAGNCTFTAKSLKSGDRFTYKVIVPKDTKPEEAKLWFVSVLTGSDNESDFSFLGTVRMDDDGNISYRPSPKSKIGLNAPSNIAWKFVFNVIGSHQHHPLLEIWHEGTCVRCGRKLTDPISIVSAIGPECRRIFSTKGIGINRTKI